MEEQKKDSDEELKEKARKISVKEGSAYSVMDGFGLRNITPYALALGAKNTHIGFLSSIPQLLGHLFQLNTIQVMKKTSRKRIAILGAIIQALMWIPLIGVGAYFFIFHGSASTAALLLIISYTILVLSGLFIGPAWNSWMKDIITKASGRYFGMRNRIIGFIALVSMLIAGVILDIFKGKNLFIGFVIIFSIAFISRMISAYLFKKKYEPKLVYEHSYYFNFFQFLKRIHKNNFGRFTIYIAAMMLATAIASPFFAVYMLKELHFNYVTYTLIIIVSSLTNLVFMPMWGKFSDRYGNIKMIKICGFFVPFVPFLWLASPFLIHFPLLLFFYLVFIEAFSGAAWAGFNLSASNFVYDTVTRQRMALCIAYSNILHSAGILVGAFLGGFVSSASFISLGLTPLLFIFLLSGIARLLVSLIFLSHLKEVKPVQSFGLEEAKKKVFSLTPRRLLQYFRT